ncbi:hypothetical protein AOLI_G00058120 [Acnodon oligacanthus]
MEKPHLTLHIVITSGSKRGSQPVYSPDFSALSLSRLAPPSLLMYLCLPFSPVMCFCFDIFHMRLLCFEFGPLVSLLLPDSFHLFPTCPSSSL